MRGENRSSISDVLQSHTQAVRAAFRAEHFEASSAQAQVGLRSVLSSAALTHTLLAVRGIGNVLNRSTTQAYTLRSLLLLRGVACSGAHTGTALHYLAAMLLRRAPHTARVVDLDGVVEAGVSALTRMELGLPRFHSLWSLARGAGHSGGAGAASSGSAGAWRLRHAPARGTRIAPSPDIVSGGVARSQELPAAREQGSARRRGASAPRRRAEHKDCSQKADRG